MTIDLIIPVYKPDKYFLEMIEGMTKQSVGINRIIVINTEQKYFDRLVYSTKLLDEHKSLEIRHISKKEYDCGKTRNSGVKLSDADFFIMMSPKAVPVGKEVISKLAKAFEDESVAVAFARPVAVDSASEAEKYVRRYYFPEDSAVHSSKDVDSLGWTAYMNTNICAMYRRTVFDELDGFLNHVIANEDIIYAAKAVNAGYKISYVADAVVVYTDSPDEKESMKQAFDFGVSVVKNPEVFDPDVIKETAKRLDKLILNHLRRNGFRSEVFEYRRLSAARKKGFGKGIKYKKLTDFDIQKYTGNPEYWRMDEILRDRKSIDSHAGYGRSEAEREMISTPPVRKNKNTEE